MEYFQLLQDPEYVNAPRIVEVATKINLRHITPADAHKIPDITRFHISERPGQQPDFIDLIDHPMLLVTPPLHKLLKLYIPKLIDKRIMLESQNQNLHQMYHLPILTTIDCLTEQPHTTNEHSLILQQIAIPDRTLFQIQHQNKTIPIVRLDLAESILRRDFRGIKLIRVQTA